MSAFLKRHPLGIAVLVIVALLFIGVIGTSDNSEEAAQGVVWLCIFLYLVLVFNIVGRVQALPLRRQENALLFLDVLSLGLQKGRSPEETFISLSKTDAQSLDVLSKPKSPLNVGRIYLCVGCIWLVIGLIVNGVIRDSGESHIIIYGNMIVTSLFTVMYFWSGWQLSNYRSWGRQLAIYLAWLNIGIAVIGLMCTAIEGIQGAVSWFLFVVMPVGILYPFVLVELTHPQVVAMCGPKGLQPPPLLTHLRGGLDLVDALKKTPWLVEARLVSLLGRRGGKDLMPDTESRQKALAGADNGFQAPTQFIR